jgi:hypothetical protein
MNILIDLVDLITGSFFVEDLPDINISVCTSILFLALWRVDDSISWISWLVAGQTPSPDTP